MMLSVTYNPFMLGAVGTFHRSLMFSSKAMLTLALGNISKR